jgi:hypothetical protein
LRENLVGTGFNEPPEKDAPYNERITVNGEIISAIGFSKEKL